MRLLRTLLPVVNSVLLTLIFISILGYFLFDANSVAEYGTCFYSSISMLEFLLYFTVNFSEMRNILKLIKTLEEFIEKSKYFSECQNGE